MERERAIEALKQPEIAQCKCNHGLEDGDTIYMFSESDIDICFEKIENIHFCPLCGKKLKKFGH